MIEPVDFADCRAAYRTASGVADRFRAVLCEVLGYDENPGDDALVTAIRARFGRYGPEPRGWQDRVAGYEAAIDQINSARRDASAGVEPVE